MTDEQLIELMIDRWLEFDSGDLQEQMRAALAVVREAWGRDAERYRKVREHPTLVTVGFDFEHGAHIFGEPLQIDARVDAARAQEKQ